MVPREAVFNSTSYIPITIKRQPKEGFKLMSLNILAQHLVDGECPAYPFINDPENVGDLQDKRYQCLANFLQSKVAKGFDILVLQEVGPLDLKMIHKVLETLNNSSFTFTFVIQPLPTGN